jgi:hypothetical protein
MCGIAGFSWSNNSILTRQQREKVFLLSALGADKRGGQSHGYLLASGNEYQIHRGMGPLVKANFRRVSKARCGFLHSRYATQGEINIENQHPFICGNIIGIHNGQCYNANQLDKLYGPTTVDSQHIFNRINLGKGLKHFIGYGVISYFNVNRPEEIFLANIGDGDLSLFEIHGPTKNTTSGYFWTSNQEDGVLALASAGLEETKDFDCYQLTEGRVYSFKRGKMYIEPNRLMVRSTERPIKREKKRYKTVSFSSKHVYDWYKDYKNANAETENKGLWDGYEDERGDKLVSGL